MAGTMGKMAVGVSGLQSSQYAINATSHNLTNTQTEGYSRQQILITDRSYNKLSVNAITTNQTGLGTVIADVKQARDSFVDKAYRQENGRMSYYKAQYETVSEVENFFGELEGQSFNTTMQGLWSSIQEVQKEPNSIVTRSSLIATAQTFIDRVTSIRESLKEYQLNLNSEIVDQVTRVNQLARDISDFNDEILKVEASKQENANDLRDGRNLLVDQLSALVKTEITDNPDGTVEIFIEGRPLITIGKVFELTTAKVNTNESYVANYEFATKATDLLMPIWSEDNSALFNIDKIPSTAATTDLGSLKGLMMSRGYFVADYTDVPVKPIKPSADDFLVPADYQSAMTQYEGDLVVYNKELDYFNTYIEPYTITNLMSQFDVLVNSLVTGINDILCPNTEITLADGTTMNVLYESGVGIPEEPGRHYAGIGMGIGNEYAGTELIIRNSTPRYRDEVTVTLADGTVATVREFNAPDDDDYYSLYTAGNIRVNPLLQQNPSLLPFSSVDGGEAQGIANELLSLWDKTFATVSPNSLVECNFEDYYAGMVELLGDRGYTYSQMAKTQEQTVNELFNQRQQVTGVSSDEELANLVKFQHAYNAASRYITTVSEMIEHLIMNLGS